MQKRHLLIGVAVVAIAAAANGASAQEVASVEEIVVTAQHRAENLQDVPIAVTALTAQAMAARGLNGAQALAQAVPGLNFDRNSGAATPFIRGIGAVAATTGNEPSVATFIDDVYMPSGSSSFFDFNNIASVEVLKGPQGTLFGRNATGGVIHVHTRDPSHTPGLEAQVSYGNYDTASGQIYATTGLTDTFAVNLAANASRQGDGWGVNRFNGEDAWRSEGIGARIKFLWEPSDRTRVLLNVSHDATIGQQGLANQPLRFGYGGFNPAAAYPGLGFYDTAINGGSVWKNRHNQISLKVSTDLGFAELVSISAYQNMSTKSLSDVDATPTDRFNYTCFSCHEKTATQEVRLLSASDASLPWIFGVFLMDAQAVFGPRYTGTAFTALGGNGTGDVRTVQDTRSWALFGQASKELWEGGRLTLGARYTSDRRKFAGTADWNLAAGGRVRAGPFTDARTFRKLTFRAALDQRLSQDVMVYAAFNRGFKSGLYNLSALAPSPLPTAAAAPPVRPETLDAWTAGLKSEWLDRRLRLNLEGFYYRYRDLQVTTVIPGGTLLVNGGQATIKGVDLEIEAVVSSAFNLTAGAVLQEGKYDRFPNGPRFFPQPPNAPIAIPAGCAFTAYPAPSGANAFQQASCDLSGNQTVHTPKFAANAAATYTARLGESELKLNLSYSYTGRYYFDADNLPADRQDRVHLLNGSARWAPGNTYSVTLWGRNLLGEKYYSYASASTTAGIKYSPAAPRTYGVTLAASF